MANPGLSMLAEFLLNNSFADSVNSVSGFPQGTMISLGGKPVWASSGPSEHFYSFPAEGTPNASPEDVQITLPADYDGGGFQLQIAHGWNANEGPDVEGMGGLPDGVNPADTPMSFQINLNEGQQSFTLADDDMDVGVLNANNNLISEEIMQNFSGDDVDIVDTSSSSIENHEYYHFNDSFDAMSLEHVFNGLNLESGQTLEITLPEGISIEYYDLQEDGNYAKYAGSGDTISVDHISQPEAGETGTYLQNAIFIYKDANENDIQLDQLVEAGDELPSFNYTVREDDGHVAMKGEAQFEVGTDANGSPQLESTLTNDHQAVDIENAEVDAANATSDAHFAEIFGSDEGFYNSKSHPESPQKQVNTEEDSGVDAEGHLSEDPQQAEGAHAHGMETSDIDPNAPVPGDDDAPAINDAPDVQSEDPNGGV